MKRVTTIVTASVAAVLLALSVSVNAQDLNWRERSYLTFSNAIELPGMTLPAGTYTFRLADTPSRDVVQVLSEDEKEIHGQFLFVQAQRPEVTSENVIVFRETKEGSTPAVQYWYYPYEKIGKEFIYPKDQAERIAARTGMPVMSDAGRISANSTANSTDSQGTVTEWKREETAAVAPAPAISGTSGMTADNTRDDRTTALAVEPAAQEPMADAVTRDRTDAVGTSGQMESTQAANELPRTGSPLLVTGLLGLLSLAGAAGLRAFRG